MLSEVGAVREADPGRVRIVRVVLDEVVRADHEEGAKIVQALPHRRQAGAESGVVLRKRLTLEAQLGRPQREVGHVEDCGRLLVEQRDQVRSEERRVGKGGVRTCRYRWSPYT